MRWHPLHLHLCARRFTQLQRLTLLHWKTQLRPVLQVRPTGWDTLRLWPQGELEPAWISWGAHPDTLFRQLTTEFCPRLSSLKLSDCHGVTPDALVLLARACPQLHSLDVQHSTVSPTPSSGAPPTPSQKTGLS